MKFKGKKWIFAGMLSTIFVLAMVSSGFCETPGIPAGFEDIEAEIYASQEATLATSQDSIGQPCNECHYYTVDPWDPNGYNEKVIKPHHVWWPSPPQYPGDLEDPHNPNCPNEPTSSTCLICHWYTYGVDPNDPNGDCLINQLPGPANGCAACHTLLSDHYGWALEFPEKCAEELLGPCAGVEAPEVMIEELVGTVIGLNLQSGIENSLDAKLDAALNALDDLNENNDVAAINSLNAFINAVEAQRGNKISNEDADMLIAAAQAIIAKIQSP
jgi:hypothetical protein